MRRRENRQFLKTALRKLSFRFWILRSVRFCWVYRKLISDIFIGFCTPLLSASALFYPIFPCATRHQSSLRRPNQHSASVYFFQL